MLHLAPRLKDGKGSPQVSSLLVTALAAFHESNYVFNVLFTAFAAFHENLSRVFYVIIPVLFLVTAFTALSESSNLGKVSLLHRIKTDRDSVTREGLQAELQIKVEKKSLLTTWLQLCSVAYSA
jgi:hypothetical protein